MYTTLNLMRPHKPCAPGWSKLLASLGKTEADDEPLSLVSILESNGLNDAIWALRACPAAMPKIGEFIVRCGCRYTAFDTYAKYAAAALVAADTIYRAYAAAAAYYAAADKADKGDAYAAYAADAAAELNDAYAAADRADYSPESSTYAANQRELHKADFIALFCGGG